MSSTYQKSYGCINNSIKPMLINFAVIILSFMVRQVVIRYDPSMKQAIASIFQYKLTYILGRRWTMLVKFVKLILVQVISS